MAKAVVGRLFLGVLQDVIGLVYSFKLLFGLWIV